MSTGALISIYNEKREVLCNIYQHGDGYLDSLGVEVGQWLNGRNAFGNNLDQKWKDTPVTKRNNGMECLAADLLAYLKTGRDSDATTGGSWGRVYLYSPRGAENGDAVYTYTIYTNEVIVRRGNRVIHTCPWDNLAAFAKTYKHDIY